jgi:poly(3-hydroxybutyrate) depolymerase
MSAFILLPLTAGFAQTTQTLNFQVAGKARSSVVHVPSGISKPAIVFFLHGAGGSGAGFENDTKGDAVADAEKFIAAYPSGIGGNWDYSDGSVDFTFIKALIDTLEARYHVDRNKVYVTGFSMGGGMTFALGCKYADIFAAIAPVSAAGAACTLGRKVPLFLTFGTNDMYPTSNYMAAVARWAGMDGCSSTPAITRPYPASNPSSGVTRITFGPCEDGTYVIADSIQGEGHQWPAANRLNQAEEVWMFFKQFSLSGATAVHRHTAATGRETVSAAYASGMVRMQGIGEKCRAKVTDTKGRLISAAAAVRGHFPFRGRPSGVYMVTVIGNNRPFLLKIVIP